MVFRPSNRSSRLAFVLLPRVASFLWRVLTAFLRNRGILLAGGVGYNILLSIVPLFALLVVLLTQVVDERTLFDVLSVQVRHLAPAHAEVLLDAVRTLLDSPEVIGLFGTLVLLVFSSFAFRMLEDALALIFHATDVHSGRSIWVSVLLPYLFMLLLGAGLLALTLLVTLAGALNSLWLALLGRELPLAGLSETALNLFSFCGVFALFSAIYKVLPVVRIALRRAIVGGVRGSAAMGRRATAAGLLFRQSLLRQRRLRLAGHPDRGAAESGGRRHHPVARRPGDRRTGA